MSIVGDGRDLAILQPLGHPERRHLDRPNLGYDTRITDSPEGVVATVGTTATWADGGAWTTTYVKGSGIRNSG